MVKRYHEWYDQEDNDALKDYWEWSSIPSEEVIRGKMMAAAGLLPASTEMFV